MTQIYKITVRTLDEEGKRTTTKDVGLVNGISRVFEWFENNGITKLYLGRFEHPMVLDSRRPTYSFEPVDFLDVNN